MIALLAQIEAQLTAAVQSNDPAALKAVVDLVHANTATLSAAIVDEDSGIVLMSLHRRADQIEAQLTAAVQSNDPTANTPPPAPPAPPVDGWAVRRRDGSIVAEIGEHASETCIWRIALGWPSDEEIASEKAAGGYSFRCRVVALLSDGCTQALTRGTLATGPAADSDPVTIHHA